MNKPLVSVVMATHNGQKFLCESVGSILNQTFKDFEFIIVNDGSTDQTGILLKRLSLRDSRIKVVEQEHRGLTRALIRGMAESRGEYIARQDDDDVSIKFRLECQVPVLRAARTVLVGCSWMNIDEEGVVLGGAPNLKEPVNLVKMLSRKNVFAHGSLMFKRDAYEACGGYSPSFPYAQDYDLILRMMRYGDIVRLSEKLYCLRLRRGSVSLSHGEEQERCARAARFLYAAAFKGGGNPVMDGSYEFARMRRMGRIESWPRFIKAAFYRAYSKLTARMAFS